MFPVKILCRLDFWTCKRKFINFGDKHKDAFKGILIMMLYILVYDTYDTYTISKNNAKITYIYAFYSLISKKLFDSYGRVPEHRVII